MKRKNKSSLLFEIQKPGARHKSYLFGTMHIVSIAFQSKLSMIESLIRSCDLFAAEVNMDNMSQIPPETFLIPNNKLLTDLIKPKRYFKIRKIFLKSAGIDLNQFAQLLPIHFLNLIAKSQIGNGDTFPLDDYLFQVAKEAGLALSGLETIEEDVEIMNRISMEYQIKMLKKAAQNISTSNSEIKKLSKMYEEGRLNAIGKHSKKNLGELKKLLLYERNVLMAERFAALSENQSLFAAVGAGHLPGQKGMLRILKHTGYRVKSIPFFK